jgi:hypothetical protein
VTPGAAPPCHSEPPDHAAVAATDSGGERHGAKHGFETGRQGQPAEGHGGRKTQGGACQRSLAAQVLRAAQMPIQYCLLGGGLQQTGMGTLILARSATTYNLTIAVFLIDALALGVKDTFFRTVGAESFEDMLDKMAATGPVEPVDASFARKLLREAVAWSTSFGFSPHRDFAVLERLFGDVDADACDTVFEFGHDGKPVCIAGPTESSTQILDRMRTVSKALALDKALEEEMPALEKPD